MIVRYRYVRGWECGRAGAVRSLAAPSLPSDRCGAVGLVPLATTDDLPGKG